MILKPGIRRGSVAAPVSKSHLHRLLVAEFLSGDRTCLAPLPGDSQDISATRRCLAALSEDTPTPVLDCGESGSTLRFLAPVAAALGKRPEFVRHGRLVDRPMIEYPTIAAGEHALSGSVSSQFVTGLLFALPLLDGDSRIVFDSSLQSRGYVDMTLRVLARAGVFVETLPEGGFRVPGRQHYAMPVGIAAEGDWSGATFWLAMNALGSEIGVTGLDADSAQPDRTVAKLLPVLPATVDVSQIPDAFPALSVVAAGMPRRTTFVGIERLRLKECDRVAAMAETLTRFGARVVAEESLFAVDGIGSKFSVGTFHTFGDHRIAMSIAVGATRASGSVEIDDAKCAEKSYPGFFDAFAALATHGDDGETTNGEN